MLVSQSKLNKLVQTSHVNRNILKTHGKFMKLMLCVICFVYVCLGCILCWCHTGHTYHPFMLLPL